MSASVLSTALARHLARIALAHATREYPNKLDHVIASAADLRAPRELHPVFYGSFDWHSCVHSYWLLAHLYREFPALPEHGHIAALFDSHLTQEKLATERAYLERATSGTFERPYGWAWLLKLAAELRRGGSDTAHWQRALAPLAQAFAQRLRDYLPKLTYPIRSGAHFNSAFALALASEYADGDGEAEFAASLRARALSWYGADRDCQAWEPSGDDFLSPALMEAECMHRLMQPRDFADWFARFLPDAAWGVPAALFTPAQVTDRTDGKIAHLDGLNLSRAWCWRCVTAGLALQHPLRVRALATAEQHLAASLPHLESDYMGAHWLGSFALLALGAPAGTA